MKYLWNASGEFFGYLLGRGLRTPDGRQVGFVKDGEIFGLDAKYLGEILEEKYLVRVISKKSKKIKKVRPVRDNLPIAKCSNIAPLPLPKGSVDFCLKQDLPHQAPTAPLPCAEKASASRLRSAVA